MSADVILAGHNLNAGYIIDNGLTFHQEEPDYIEPLFGLLSHRIFLTPPMLRVDRIGAGRPLV